MRHPRVAGQFYSSDPQELRAQIEALFMHSLGPGSIPVKKDGENLLGIMAPHAGYMYSGPVAAHSYKALAENFPRGGTIIVIGPNHTGYGAPVALTTQDWRMPLGDVHIDRELAELLMEGGVADDMSAHRYEHSVEVQLPFIQYFSDDFLFLPIVMMDQSMRSAVALGRLIRMSLDSLGRKAVIVASTDFSHYVPRETAYRNDAYALSAIERMDVDGLYSAIKRHGISMCGYGPVSATMEAVRGLSGRVEILKYATSGDIMPMREVVGYGSAGWFRE